VLMSASSYVELVILHPVGSAGHVLHFGVFGARNIDTIFFVLECDRYGSYKKRVGTRYVELVFFCIHCDLRGT
jgi:hypothetical protein